jgi:hypothetical protein
VWLKPCAHIVGQLGGPTPLLTRVAVQPNQQSMMRGHSMGRPWLSVVEPLWLRRLFALRVHQLVRDGKALVVGWFVFAFCLLPVCGESGARRVLHSMVGRHGRGWSYFS